MRATLLRAVALILLLPAAAAAHRLDEYLQATRLSVAHDGVRVEVDLTPGANVFTRIASRVDRDGDGTIAPVEAEAYGRAVVADLVLAVNDRAVPLRLERVEAPTLDEMSEGLGTIRVTARALFGERSASALHVRLRNNHASDESVYLINALAAVDRGLVLERQSRDVQQREIALDYSVRPGPTAQLAWLSMALVGAVALLAMRRG